VTDPQRRADLYARMGRFREAAEAAVAARDPDMLSNVRHRCKDPSIEAFIDQLASANGML